MILLQKEKYKEEKQKKKKKQTKMRNQSIGSSIDWITLLLYIALVIMGWMTIYSASLPLEETSIFDLSQIYGRQMLFIGLTIPIIFRSEEHTSELQSHH